MNLDDAAQTYARLKRPLTEYLDEMGVPRHYADIMLQTSSQDTYALGYPEIMENFVGWTPETEEWLIAKCHTVSEKQLDQEEKKALQSKQLDQFIAFRDTRASCIWEALLGERINRRKAY
jgi:hypothetical protein